MIGRALVAKLGVDAVDQLAAELNLAVDAGELGSAIARLGIGLALALTSGE
jgi:hypothetical protein